MPKIFPMAAAEQNNKPGSAGSAQHPDQTGQGRQIAPAPVQKAQIAILAITAGALELGAQLAQALPADLYPCKGQIRERFAGLWHNYEALICIMASGIVVRQLAPLMHDKYHDPAVLVLDERGCFVISLLSGHLGGANALARQVAAITGGQAVLTTASDVLGLTALDLWCHSLGVQVADTKRFTQVMGRLVNRGYVRLWVDTISLADTVQPAQPALPPDIHQAAGPAEADLFISPCLHPADQPAAAALLHPKILVVGIGCKRGTSKEQIAEAVSAALSQHGLALQALAQLASIDLKANENGLLSYAAEHQLPLTFFSKDELNQVAGVSFSEPVFRATGARGVAEPAALLAAGAGARLLVAKMKWPAVTVAVACMAWPPPPVSAPKDP
jgi:cobalt-precorrin 5A hydrolase